MLANELEGSVPAVGEELLILRPTRTHKVVFGDTPERLAIRYGVSVRELTKLNPWIAEEGLIPNTTVAIRCGVGEYGMSVTNGYCYPGCTRKMLRRALPYLTYVTFGAAIVEGGRARWLFDAEDAVREVKEAEKIPLLRVFNQKEVPHGRGERERYTETLITLAKSGGYKGIVLGIGGKGSEELCDFLIEIKKGIIGSDLILFTELTEDSHPSMCECADGSIFSYSKIGSENPPSFKDGERHAYERYATEMDSIKSFIDIPALACTETGYCDVSEALRLARSGGYKIEYDGDSMLSHFRHKRVGNCRFGSLKALKAILALVGEYGFMGVSFDIMRTPLSYLLMYNDMFGTAYGTQVSSPSGCSRANED